MALKDLTLTEAEKKKQDSPVEVTREDDVPWGLSINLGEREIEKLGLGGEKLKVGAEITAMVKLRVTNTSEFENEGGKDRSVGMSIIAMEIETSDRLKKAADTMFGDE